MGGTVNIDSKIGQGTTVRFEIIVGVPTEDEAQDGSIGMRTSDEENETGVTTRMLAQAQS